MQIDPKARTDINTITNLQVLSQNGKLIPLVAVADIRFGSGPATIKRYDRARQVAVEANLQGISLGEAVQAINKLPVMQNLPPTVAQQPSGSAQNYARHFRAIWRCIGFGINVYLCNSGVAV